MSQILVIGSTGQLAEHLKLKAKNSKHQWRFLAREQLDLTQVNTISSVLMQEKFDVLINAAAYTKVDLAEKEQELCRTINVLALEQIAKICTQKKATLIGFSTDYVFDGKKNIPYQVNDIAIPLNFYGRSKLESEEVLKQIPLQYVMIRTSWVYSHFGHNFYKTILNNALKKKMNVVFDQLGTPTYAGDLADFVLHLIDQKLYENSLLHFSNEGVASWYDFAKAITHFNHLKADISPIRSHQYPQVAQRPSYSVLDKSETLHYTSFQGLHWMEALEKMIQQKG